MLPDGESHREEDERDGRMTTFKALKTAYQHALESGSQEFMLDGRILFVGYAKYLIEYMDMGGARDAQEIYFKE